jgi:branched-chain amino acid transport system substrate-binding protein
MRKLWNLGILLLLVVSLAACQGSETIKIGFIGTLTGTYADVGVNEMYGVQYAVDEINSAGGINGKNLELLVRDDKADVETAMAVQDDLYDLGVRVVIGHSLSIVAEEAVAHANELGLLLLSPSIGTDELSDLDDMLIRNVATVYGEGSFIASKMQEEEPGSVLFIYDENNYVLTKYHEQAFNDVFSPLLQEEDIYTLGFSDFDLESDQIESLLQSETFDSLMIAASNYDTAAIINFIVSEQITIDIHVTSWGSTDLLNKIETEQTSNIFTYYNYDDQVETSDFIYFKESFKDTYGLDVNMLSVNAYDMVKLLEDALLQVSYDANEIKDYIIETGNFEGINSDFYINEYGDTIRDFVQFEIVENAYVRVD